MASADRTARFVMLTALAALLSGCTAHIDQSSFLPPAVEPPKATLVPPPGYSKTDAMLDLPSLGKVHAVRLDNPASDTAIIFSGGNHSFVSVLSGRAAALAAAPEPI